MSCEDIRDLLPAYALGMLDGEEIGTVEAHLRDCRSHDAELVELRATSFALEMLEEDAASSPALEAGVRRIATTSPAGWRPPSTPRWWLVAAAAVALFAVFGGGWLSHAYFEDSDSPPAAVAEVRYAYALQGADGEFVSFTGLEGSDRVTVTMAGLERLTDGRLYRLWTIRAGQWVRIGQCNTNQQGGWVGDFAFSLGADEEVAVTIEVPSADPQPRGAPILRSSS